MIAGLRFAATAAFFAVETNAAAWPPVAADPAEGAAPVERAADDRVHSRWLRFQPRFTPEECPFLGAFDRETISCGYVLVPENRRLEDSRLIKLAVMKVESTSDAPAAGALVRLDGGPGGPSLSLGRAMAFSGGAGGKLRAVADLYYFDQRGIGYSEARFCRAIPQIYQFGVPIDPDGKDMRIDALRTCVAEARARGVDVDAYTTWDNALDVRDLRRALGYDRWNVFGVSYGTELGQAVLLVDEPGVRSIVLDSVVPADPERGWELTGYGFRSALTALSVACLDDPACAEAHPDLAAETIEVVSGYDREPLALDVDPTALFPTGRMVLDGSAVGGLIFNLLYAKDFYGDMPMLLDVLRDRDEAAIRAYAENAPVPALDHQWGGGMQLVANCTGAAPSTPEAEARALLDEPELSRWSQSYFREACEKVLGGVRPGAHARRVESAARTLIIAGEIDPITPPVYAPVVAAGLPNSQIVTFPYTGHGPLRDWIEGCGGDILADFLTTPGEIADTSCAADTPAPDFVVDYRRTGAAYAVVSSLLGGAPSAVAVMLVGSAFGLAISILTWPVGFVGRIIDSATRTHGGDEIAAVRLLSFAVAAAGLTAAFWAAQMIGAWIRNHPLGLPAGLPTSIALPSMVATLAGALSLLNIVLAVRARSSAQTPTGSVIGAALTSLAMLALTAGFYAIGATPF